MPVFRSFDIQVSPRPIVFLSNAEKDSFFCETFELNEHAEIACYIMTYDDATDQCRANEAELSDECSGYVTVDKSYLRGAVYVAVSNRQFDLLVNAALSSRYKSLAASVEIALLSDFKIIQHRRVYRVGSPLITLSSRTAA